MWIKNGISWGQKVRKLINKPKRKNSNQLLMHKKEQDIHISKSYNKGEENYTSYLKAAATTEDKLSTQMGIKETTTKVFNRHIHISTAPSITASYLNIYLIDLIKNPMGINKRVKNKVNYI